VLLLDEPFTGLDQEASGHLMRNMRAARDAGKTCVLTTHDIGQGLACATRVAILEDGRFVHEGPVPSGGAAEMRALYEGHLGRPAA